MSSLGHRLLGDDPELRKAYGHHAPKRDLALALRALRKGKGLSQLDVSMKSGMTQPQISRMESPSGPMPETDSISRYAAACGFDMVVAFPPHGAAPGDLSVVNALIPVGA